MLRTRRLVLFSRYGRKKSKTNTYLNEKVSTLLLSLIPLSGAGGDGGRKRLAEKSFQEIRVACLRGVGHLVKGWWSVARYSIVTER